MTGEALTTPPTRDQVIEAWTIVSQRGIGDPAELSHVPTDPIYIEADRLFTDWYQAEKERAEAQATPEAMAEFSFSATTLFVEAGFRGQEYLDRVANDWLLQDEQQAADKGLIDLLQRIIIKRAEINSLLNNSEGN